MAITVGLNQLLGPGVAAEDGEQGSLVSMFGREGRVYVGISALRFFILVFYSILTT